jgi:hypothetical protein
MNIDSRINKYTENKQNKTTIMILQVVMQIRTNCDETKMWNKKKQKLMKTLIWLLNNPNIIEENWFGRNK